MKEENLDPCDRILIETENKTAKVLASCNGGAYGNYDGKAEAITSVYRGIYRVSR